MTADELRSILFSRKFLIAIAAGAYFLWCAWDPYQWHLVDGANLLIHEAGHFFFRPFGEFLMIAGGSLLQVIMPVIFVIYFFRREETYSAALVMFWVGESLINVSVYAGDSIRMQLPLIGGEDSVHDWNYMLVRMGLLSATSMIAGAIRLCGTLIIITGLLLAIKNSIESSRME